MAKKLSEIFATNPAAALDGSELVEFTQAGVTVAGTVDDILAFVEGSPIASYLTENPATTTGLTWGWKAGLVRNGTTIAAVAAGTLTLTASATNYVQVTAAGVVSANVTAFTTGSIPLRTIVTGATAITTSTDERAWLSSTDLLIPYTGATKDVDLGSNSFAVNTKQFCIDAATGRIGIGTNTPDYSFEVINTESFVGAFTYAGRFENAPTVSGARCTGGYFQSYVVDASIQTVYTAAIEGINISDAVSGVVPLVYGLNFQIENRNTGTITDAIGINLGIGNYGASTGVITTAKGISAQFSGAITTAFGVYIEATGATTGYGIYQLGPSDINYFKGAIGLGTKTPKQALEVNGGARLNTAAARPIADANSEGTIWVVRGASGVADTLQICLKSAADTYSWITLATG